jgi:lipopolysaccharide heptosyltransferase II
MFQHLQIPYREERWLVGLADAGLHALTFLGSPFRSAAAVTGSPKRILLLRLERVGDLLMVLDAIARVRALAPQAQIDLVVGSWNLPLARLIPAVDSIETLDVPWMARGGRALSWQALVPRAKAWRHKGYDLAINFEPDIRSNLLLAFSGARRKVGFASGGGGAVLSEAVEPEPAAHIAANAMTLVSRAFGAHSSRASLALQDPSSTATLTIPEQARRRAAELLGPLSPASVTIGLQPAAGRQIKEWDPVRFAEVGSALARTRGANVVLIGSTSDRQALDAVRAAWPADVARIDLPEETDLVILAAVLERLALFITGDTGPMHLAAAVGTPVLAIFGPSLPTRYAPLSPKSRILRIDIPCSPCNLMRRPPERCVGHVPDCLAGIESAQVLKTANEMIDA